MRQQCSSVNYQTRQRYVATQLAFSQWCSDKHWPWHSSSIPHWFSERQLCGKYVAWAENTLQQKLTHLNFLASTHPPILPGGVLSAPRLISGLGKLSLPPKIKHMLPPSFLITLSLLENPMLIHTTIQLQALIGLRGGHLCLVNPMSLQTEGVLVAPPFKRQLKSVMVDIRHVPRWLIQQFLSHKKNDYSPIMPWTAVQYQAKFKQCCQDFRLPSTSHAARHTYASVHAFLNEPRALISQILIHKAQRTLKTYVHELPLCEQRVVLDNPQYFQIRRFC